MKYFLIIVFFGFSFVSIGQETKKIKAKTSSNEREVFYVLKTNKDIKHGQYELFYNKWLKMSGRYSNNQKEGLWTKYASSASKAWEGYYKDGLKNGLWITYSHSGKVNTKGEYKDDKRIGVWEFYDNKGVLIQKYDFEKRKLVIIDSTDLNKKVSIYSGQFDGLIYVDTMPTYKKGEAAFLQFIANNIKYPIEARENGISGVVYISLFVDENGELFDFSLYRGIGGGCDEEAMRVLKMTNGNWNAASFNGQKVVSKMMVPIAFRLY